MIFVGIDVHYKTSTFCFFDPAAKLADQYRTRTCVTTAEAYRELLAPLKGECRIAYEVGTQAQWVASIVRPLAVEVQVANAGKVRWLYRDVKKTDRLDARKLATLLYLGQLPTVHLPSAKVSAWRQMINYRRKLVSTRTVAKNQVRALLRGAGLQCPYGSCWTGRGRGWLGSLKLDPVRQLMMTLQLEQVDAINRTLSRVHAELNAMARQEPRVALLRTIPGVGPRTAEALVAFSDDVHRFRRSRQFAAYFGMVPLLDRSADVCRYGHITKHGPSVVRWVLVEATYQAIRRNTQLRAFYERVRHQNPKRTKKAVVATGRKLLTVIFSMLRDGTQFDANRLSGAA